MPDPFVDRWSKIRDDKTAYLLRTTLWYGILMLIVTEGMDLLGMNEPYVFDAVRLGKRLLLAAVSGFVVSLILWWSNERTYARRTRGE